MLMPASTEFISLCRTQVALVVDGFGASLGAIYLTEDPTADDETTLVPLVSFPEPAEQWFPIMPLLLSGEGKSMVPLPQGQPPATQPIPDPESLTPSRPETVSASPSLALPELLPAQRLVLPLVHEEIMWGLLVVARKHRRWQPREQAQLKHIAQTLAIACVLDQRSQWLAQGHDQRKFLQAQQHTTLSTLLHQFRNPLTTLRTLGKLLLKRMKPDDAHRDLVDSIVGESDHLERLLRQFDDAIDLGDAALESELTPQSGSLLPLPLALPPSSHWLSKTGLTLQPCWLAEILQTAVHALAGRIDEQTMQLHLSIPDHLPPVWGDANALQEIFGNLLDNALKYTPPNGTLVVTLSRDSQQRCQAVQISDSGCGIPPQDLDRVFERSYRGIQAQTAIPGTGLGLAIAQDLVTQMGGTLQAYSPALDSETGQGSTFVVQLPEGSEA